MPVLITVPAYVEYLRKAAGVIEENKDCITALDAKTGDGDHWVNLDMGFRKILTLADGLEVMSFSEMFRKVGITIMSAVGGSSGVLYGAAYMAAAKTAEGLAVLDGAALLAVLEAELQAIMSRGGAKPGFKTMVDSLHQAVRAYAEALAATGDGRAAVEELMRGAREGAEATRSMEAVKGRASYQAGKGVGELDPGAVTMCMQLVCLGEHILASCLGPEAA